MIRRSLIASIVGCLFALALAPATLARGHHETGPRAPYCGMDLCRSAVNGPLPEQPARTRHQHIAHHAAHQAAAALPITDASGNAARGLVTVPTAAGIRITVASDFAPRIQAVISDVVASGIKPRQIHCYARDGHVHGSRHYSGHACDLDFYRGCMGCSARWTRGIGAIVERHGLRDGCTFGDCGHIDDGMQVAHRTHRTRYAHASAQ